MSTISAVSGSRHLSQAISEGERISVLVEVRDGEAARAAAEHGATGVVLRGLADGLADRPDVPVLVYGPSARDAAEIGADAVVLGVDGDDDLLGELVHQAAALGLECVVRVGDEGELQRALELVDPEIVLLVAEG